MRTMHLNFKGVWLLGLVAIAAVMILVFFVFVAPASKRPVSEVQQAVDTYCKHLDQARGFARENEDKWGCYSYDDINWEVHGVCVNDQATCLPCLGEPHVDVDASRHDEIVREIQLFAGGEPYKCHHYRSTLQAAEKQAGGVIAQPTMPAEDASTAETFLIEFTTNKGTIVFEAHRSWSPLGVARLYDLVTEQFYNTQKVYFFRAIKGFVAQFGIHGDPSVSREWRSKGIKDDVPSGHSNTKGTIAFAAAGKDTRTTQMFFNLVDNGYLDNSGFTPLGKVVSGMDVMDAISTKYGEAPNQGLIQQQGNEYLEKMFSDLDYISHAKIIHQ